MHPTQLDTVEHTYWVTHVLSQEGDGRQDQRMAPLGCHEKPRAYATRCALRLYVRLADNSRLENLRPPVTQPSLPRQKYVLPVRA